MSSSSGAHEMPLDEINDTEEDQYKTIEQKALHLMII